MSDENRTPLTIRERGAIRALILAVKIAAPSKHSHQLSDTIKTLEADLVGS